MRALNLTCSHFKMVSKYWTLACFYLALLISPALVAAADTAELQKAFSAGRIPTVFAEEVRLVPPESGEGQRFQAAMSTILKRLYPNQNLNVQFLLVDDEGPNAFRIAYAFNPVMIGISRDLLKILENEDQLAGVLAHEITHYFLALKYGEGKNSKGEEALADYNSLQDVANAGYDPVQVQILIAKLATFTHQNSTLYTFLSVLDVHPTNDVRRKALELALTELHRSRGALTATPRPMPNAILGVISEPQHESYVEMSLRTSGWFPQMSLNDKIDLLSNLVMKTYVEGLWNASRFEDFRKYFGDLLTHDQLASLHLRKDPFSSSQTLTKLDALVNLFTTMDASHTGIRYGRSLYISLCQLKKEDSYSLGRLQGDGFVNHRKPTIHLPPLGYSRIIANWLEQFMHTTDAAQALALSQQILNQVDLLTKHNEDTGIALSVEWPRFQFEPKSVPVAQLPWNRLVELAQTDSTDQILTVLYIFGIHDPRLFKEMGLRTFELGMKGIKQISDWPSVKDPYSEDQLQIGNFKIKNGIAIWPFENATATPELKSDSNLNSQIKLSPSQLIQVLEANLKASTNGDQAATDRLLRYLDLDSRDRSIGAAKDDFLFGRMKDFEENFDLTMELNSAFAYSQNLSKTKLIEVFNELLAKNPDKFRPMIRRYFIGAHGNLRSFNKKSAEIDINFDKADFDFVLEAPDTLFSREEKLNFFDARLPSNFIGGAMYSQYGTMQKVTLTENFYGYKSEMNDFLKPIQDLIGYTRPQSWEELYIVVKKLETSPHRIARIAAVEELIHFLFNHGKQGLDFVRFIATLRDAIKVYNPERSYGADLNVYRVELRKWFTEDLFQGQIHHIVNSWTWAWELSLLPPLTSSRVLVMNRILPVVEGVKDPQWRIDVLKKIFQGPGFDDPTQREQARKLFAKSLRSLYGYDDGTPQYAEELKGTLNWIQTSIKNFDMRNELLKSLGEILQTQDLLSQELDKVAHYTTRKDLENSQAFGVGGEIVIKALYRDVEFSRAVAIFLTAPVTDKSVATLYAALEVSKSKPHARWDEEQGRTKQTYLDDFGAFHREYWAQTLLVRTAIADLILDPSLGGESYQNRFDFVVNEIIPKHPTYHEITKELLDAYLGTLEDYQRGPYLSAIMAASLRSESDSSINSPGKFLGTVLEQMGPAEKKAAQAIHSYPQTPEDIREGMKHVKVMAEVPTRWEIWKLIRELPESVRSQILLVNGVEGAASFWVVLNVTLKDGSKLLKANKGNKHAALALLRPYARERADDGFDRGQRFVNQLSSEALRSTLMPIVQEAKKLAALELDPTLTVQQFSKEQELYAGLNVYIDGEKFAFDAARLLGDAHGPNFRMMSLAVGEHFNSIADRIGEYPDRIHKWAVAHIFVEMSFLLGGLETDEDPHGGNVRIDLEHNILTRIDPGGIAPHKPSVAELNALGSLLYQVMNQMNSNQDTTPAQILALLATAEAKHPEAKAFLIRAQKSVLALQDFWRYLQPGDVEAIFKSIYRANLISKHVINGIWGKTNIFSRIQRMFEMSRLVKKPEKKCEDVLDIRVERNWIRH